VHKQERIERCPLAGRHRPRALGEDRVDPPLHSQVDLEQTNRRKQYDAQRDLQGLVQPIIAPNLDAVQTDEQRGDDDDKSAHDDVEHQ